MSIISEQSTFCADIARLTQYVQGLGWAISEGEGWRPDEMQKIYFEQKKSLTMKNDHGDRLAHDFNFFQKSNGTFEWVTDRKRLQWIGDFWKALDPDRNKWGGEYKDKNGKPFEDTFHFARKV